MELKYTLFDKIPFITSTILKSVDESVIKKIYLFGSYAYGKPDKDSDIDLCIVISDTSNDDASYLNIARALFKERLVNIDLLLYKEHDFFNSKNAQGVEHTIMSRGSLLYG